jgi:cyclopropane-fatty-acyl-phospholipid synthase
MTPCFTGRFSFFFSRFCPTTFAGSDLSCHLKLKYILQVATEADLGLADAYINGYFSFVDKREGLLNLFLVRSYNLNSQVKQLAHVF